MKRYAILIVPVLLALAVYSGSQTAYAGQANAPAPSEPAKTITVPGDTSVLGRLLTNLDAAQAKVGDPVEVQILEDIKSGHEVPVKKGSTLNGHITSIQLFTTKDSQCVIAVLFDRVKLKNNEQLGLNLAIQALAPPMDVKMDTLMGGRGFAQTGNDAAVAGRTDAMTGSVDGLSHKSTGAYALPGVSIATQTENGKRISLVVSTSGNIHLKKGTQIVMQSVS